MECSLGWYVGLASGGEAGFAQSREEEMECWSVGGRREGNCLGSEGRICRFRRRGRYGGKLSLSLMIRDRDHGGSLALAGLALLLESPQPEEVMRSWDQHLIGRRVCCISCKQ